MFPSFDMWNMYNKRWVSGSKIEHFSWSRQIKCLVVTDLRFSVFEHTVTGNGMRSKIKRKENKQHSNTAPLPSACDQILKSRMFSASEAFSTAIPSIFIGISVTFNVAFWTFTMCNYKGDTSPFQR